jgi:hypothetical protein
MPNPIERAAAKGVGAAKAAKAHLEGLHGVFSTLARQHGEASLLLSRTASAEGAKRLELWQQVRAELMAHEQAELEVVYPALAQHPQLHSIVRRHEMDAARLEAAIAEVDAASGTDAWTGSLDVLRQLVKRHAEEEEEEFFPLASESLDRQTTKSLEERFDAARQDVLNRLGVH